MGKFPLDADEIDFLRSTVNVVTGKVWTFADIAEYYGVSRQYVYQVWKKGRGKLSPRQRAREYYPWSVPPSSQGAHQYHRLTDHAEYCLNDGRKMSDQKLLELSRFYAFLKREDLVVEYNPQVDGGFCYQPRQDTDDDLIVRRNEHTTINEHNGWVWTFPDTLPTT